MGRKASARGIMPKCGRKAKKNPFGSPPLLKAELKPGDNMEPGDDRIVEIIRPQDYDEAERIILDTLTRAAERVKVGRSSPMSRRIRERDSDRPASTGSVGGAASPSRRRIRMRSTGCAHGL